MDNKKTFVFNLEWHEILENFEPQVRHEVYDAVIKYVNDGTVVQLSPVAKMAFCFIKRELDFNIRQSKEKMEKRREAALRKSGIAKSKIQADCASYTAIVPETNVNPSQIVEKQNALGSRNEALKMKFEQFRQAYPGRKRGLNVEFENFCKHNPDKWPEIVPLLAPALDKLMNWSRKTNSTDRLVPRFKDLQSWLDQRCWATELPDPDAIVRLCNPEERS